MNEIDIDILQGKKVEILEMFMKNVDNQLEIQWKIFFENSIFTITFYNVSRFSVEELSAPLEIHGFEIVNHYQQGWEKDSRYEIHDFEDNRISFFCEYFKINNI